MGLNRRLQSQNDEAVAKTRRYRVPPPTPRHTTDTTPEMPVMRPVGPRSAVGATLDQLLEVLEMDPPLSSTYLRKTDITF